jgi:uncharacterized damage-inducible protein DinB
MNRTWFTSQLGYHYWANKRLLGALQNLTEEQYTRDLGGSFPSIQATIAHLMNAEVSWMSRLTGEARQRVTAEDVPTVAAATERWAELEEEYLALLESPGDGGFDRPIHVTMSTGQEFTHTVTEVLQHLVNHGTYHRGQVTTMIRQIGLVPVALDMIRYFRHGA